MNFLSLYNRLKTSLAENSTPKYWTEEELKQYLNEANLAFVQHSEILTNHVYLDIAEEDNNSWFLPNDVISIKGLQFKGKPISFKRIQYIETTYAGTAHNEVKIGRGRDFQKDWRLIVGEPICFYRENNFIRLFPRPFYGNNNDSPRMMTSSILFRGDNTSNLSVLIPFLGKSLVDVYVNGVYQDFNTWEIVENTSDSSLSAIRFNWSAESDVDYSVYVTYQTSPVLAAKYVSEVLDGQTEIFFPECAYTPGSDSARVVLNGVTLLDNEYVVETVSPATVKVTLTVVEPAVAGTMELTVFRKQSVESAFNRLTDRNVSIDYCYSPALLVNDEDEPEYPSVYHSAVWQYAAWLALSKEGEKTQDFQKARFYLGMFEQTVAQALKESSVPIDIDFSVVAPFVL